MTLIMDRSSIVGATGVAKAACAKSLCAPPKLQPDSLTLLEAAFSHYGFSAKIETKDPFLTNFWQRATKRPS